MLALFAQIMPSNPEDLGPLIAQHKWGLVAAVTVLIFTKVIGSFSTGFFGTRYGKLAAAGLLAAATAVVHAVATAEPALSVATEALAGFIGAIGLFSTGKNLMQGNNIAKP